MEYLFLQLDDRFHVNCVSQTEALQPNTVKSRSYILQGSGEKAYDSRRLMARPNIF